MLHKIKILESFADAIYLGDKTFEIRENNRGYQKGDKVKFTVIEDHGRTYRSKDHPLNGHYYEITYVVNGWGLKDGFVCFGIKECLDSPSN